MQSCWPLNSPLFFQLSTGIQNCLDNENISQDVLDYLALHNKKTFNSLPQFIDFLQQSDEISNDHKLKRCLINLFFQSSCQFRLTGNTSVQAITAEGLHKSPNLKDSIEDAWRQFFQCGPGRVFLCFKRDPQWIIMSANIEKSGSYVVFGWSYFKEKIANHWVGLALDSTLDYTESIEFPDRGTYENEPEKLHQFVGYCIKHDTAPVSWCLCQTEKKPEVKLKAELDYQFLIPTKISEDSDMMDKQFETERELLKESKNLLLNSNECIKNKKVDESIANKETYTSEKPSEDSFADSISDLSFENDPDNPVNQQRDLLKPNLKDRHFIFTRTKEHDYYFVQFPKNKNFLKPDIEKLQDYVSLLQNEIGYYCFHKQNHWILACNELLEDRDHVGRQIMSIKGSIIPEIELKDEWYSFAQQGLVSTDETPLKLTKGEVEATEKQLARFLLYCSNSDIGPLSWAYIVKRKSDDYSGLKFDVRFIRNFGKQ